MNWVMTPVTLSDNITAVRSVGWLGRKGDRIYAHPKYELWRSQNDRIVNRLMMGSNTSGATKHMIRSNMFYTDTCQIGVADVDGLIHTGTRSCSVYLEGVTRSVPTHLNCRCKLTDVANCSEERQRVPLREWRWDSRGVF